jgi:hypothetical protein
VGAHLTPVVAVVALDGEKSTSAVAITVAHYSVHSVSLWWLRSAHERTTQTWSCPLLTTTPAWTADCHHVRRLVRLAEQQGCTHARVVRDPTTRRPLCLLLSNLDELVRLCDTDDFKATDDFVNLFSPHVLASWSYYSTNRRADIFPPSFDAPTCTSSFGQWMQQVEVREANARITRRILLFFAAPSPRSLQPPTFLPTASIASKKRKSATPGTSTPLGKQDRGILRYFTTTTKPTSPVPNNDMPASDDDHWAIAQWLMQSTSQHLPCEAEESLRRSMEVVYHHDEDDDAYYYNLNAKRRAPLALTEYTSAGDAVLVCHNYFNEHDM